MASAPQPSIEDAETLRLAKALAELTGKSVTEAVTEALRERPQRERQARSKEGVADKLMEIAEERSKLPMLDPRNPDEILYDDDGLPK